MSRVRHWESCLAVRDENTPPLRGEKRKGGGYICVEEPLQTTPNASHDSQRQETSSLLLSFKDARTPAADRSFCLLRGAFPPAYTAILMPYKR